MPDGTYKRVGRGSADRMINSQELLLGRRARRNTPRGKKK